MDRARIDSNQNVAGRHMFMNRAGVVRGLLPLLRFRFGMPVGVAVCMAMTGIAMMVIRFTSMNMETRLSQVVGQGKEVTEREGDQDSIRQGMAESVKSHYHKGVT